MSKKQKLLIKVIDEGDWKWVHFCHIDKNLFKQFKELYPEDSFVLSTFITTWIREDFQVTMSMVYKKNVLQLRNLIETWYRKEYPELYLKNCPGDKRRITSLISVWMTQHMQYEIERRRKGETEV